MSISKSWTEDQRNIEAALKMYRSLECPTLQMIAKSLGATVNNVQAVCKNNLPEAEYKALSALRYRASKQAEKNPMYGKIGDRHHNWIGLVEDGHGYLTCLQRKNGVSLRKFVHRIVMGEALGIALDESWVVHHIDGDPKNNKLDNLALVTRRGHRNIHFLQTKDSIWLASKKSTLREALKYLISR